MRIDVFHDIACPWCRIGKKHLQLALAQWHGDVDVHYHTFFLNDRIPAEGADFRSYMMAKGGGTVTDIEQFFAAPREMGERVGLTFNFERITKAPNTLLAHRLIALTPESQQVAMIDALYDAYFEHGQDVGDLDVLLTVAGQVGLDEASVRARLQTDEAEQSVLDEARGAKQIGVTGVPLFVFGNTFALSGAQPPDVILQVMKQTEDMVG